VVLDIITASNDISCAGITKKGLPCQYDLGGDPKRQARRLLDSMSQRSPREALNDLPQLARLCLCQKWHQAQAADVVANWTDLIETYVSSLESEVKPVGHRGKISGISSKGGLRASGSSGPKLSVDEIIAELDALSIRQKELRSMLQDADLSEDGWARTGNRDACWSPNIKQDVRDSIPVDGRFSPQTKLDSHLRSLKSRNVDPQSQILQAKDKNILIDQESISQSPSLLSEDEDDAQDEDILIDQESFLEGLPLQPEDEDEDDAEPIWASPYDDGWAYSEEEDDTALNSALSMEHINRSEDDDGGADSESGEIFDCANLDDERLLYPAKYFLTLKTLEAEVLSRSVFQPFKLLVSLL
jgi:hypothetical protein